jgi:putative hydrolase of the HAD superfamily
VLTGRVDPDVMALLTEVRRTVPVVLLSNATIRLESYLAEIGLSESFDAVVNTAGHVVAAREAGLTGLHYQHVGQLRDAVAPLLRRG